MRRHILECAGHVERFGSIILLEDDLYVDPWFYHYTTAALNHYEGDDSVGGIALYAPSGNEFCRLPFAPRANGYDTYPMQTACSWGQAWTVSQWRTFRSWYDSASSNDVSNEDRLPPSLRQWPETSWKKYFATWLVKTERSFIYPYTAWVSNFSDAGGTHGIDDSSRLQIPLGLPERPRPDLRFCPTQAPEVAYDPYMEPCGASVERALQKVGHNLQNVEIDTYGMKPDTLLAHKPLTLSARANRAPQLYFQMARRPLEANIGVLDDPASGAQLTLGPSAEVRLGPHLPNIAEYAYRYNGAFGSIKFVQTFCGHVPKLLAQKIIKRLKR